MVKNYLNKLLIILAVAFLFFAKPVFAEEAFSQLFVKVTDATRAVEQGNQAKAKQLVAEIKEGFEQLENHDSPAGKEVSKALTINEVTKENLTTISSELLKFDKEQHPVDLKAEKEKLVSRLESRFADLQAAISAKNLEQTRSAYKKMNSTWTVNEGVVRDNSTAHYGRIETAISFLRSAIETEPVDFSSVQSSFDDLKTAIDSFVKGEELATTEGNLTLKDGIQLLEKALDEFKAGKTQEASSNMKKFITIWPSIEGDVSTRNPSLYTRVESETPVIMVKGSEKEYQDQLQALINDLSQIDTSASYNFFDAMLILLREGVEALLIVMALVTTLKAAKMNKGLKWVYTGAVMGILASLAIAVLLQFLFPAVSSGSNREIIEGAVGIFAVLMMILVGIWLHSKSSIKKWNDFMESQMKAVTATGSFISMFALSFLAVFREGAETILFYAGIYPRIDKAGFFLGIGLAFLVLFVLALVMNKASAYFKPHRIFLILTWLIYALAFKMLGVSIHALQLTNILPSHLMNGFTSIDWAGIYPSLEVVTCQLIFVVIVLIITWKNRENSHGS
ncbi:FTR1 family iron permease [Streptococcus gordonii]|uniref:FTR1 family iron permease n=1 Tax=Streptococcus TaxID=1301 RepID=UPI0005F32B5E|nr:FTR1 family protein [Streptococcus gordonii]KJU95344.1 Ferrous iron permease EfeU [Streptococcus gordonii]MBZ2147994.1 FTR1 family iron permease [Streptococcus gordonii]MCG4822363.1 FTR1 family iron permease [Streptococcus gordonii]MCG4847625.1 FTR1 family iron permease [Streptococcus gordonii]MCY7133837.1 FTR1 family iron permease [Streptococcus gordonii]